MKKIENTLKLLLLVINLSLVACKEQAPPTNNNHFLEALPIQIDTLHPSVLNKKLINDASITIDKDSSLNYSTRSIYHWFHSIDQRLINAIEKRTVIIMIRLNTDKWSLNSKEAGAYEHILQDYNELVKMIAGSINGYSKAITIPYMTYNEHESGTIEITLCEAPNCIQPTPW